MYRYYNVLRNRLLIEITRIIQFILFKVFHCLKTYAREQSMSSPKLLENLIRISDQTLKIFT